jgi:hypothetical protein
LRLLLDEDTQARRLVVLLRTGGHEVLTVGEADRIGTADTEVLTLAAATGRALLTRNCADYLALHERGAAHSGVLCVYQDSDMDKAMGRACGVRSRFVTSGEYAVPTQNAGMR